MVVRAALVHLHPVKDVAGLLVDRLIVELDDAFVDAHFGVIIGGVYHRDHREH